MAADAYAALESAGWALIEKIHPIKHGQKLKPGRKGPYSLHPWRRGRLPTPDVIPCHQEPFLCDPPLEIADRLCQRVSSHSIGVQLLWYVYWYA